MLHAEARNIIDTLNSVKWDDDTVLDAIECLKRIRTPTMRDIARVVLAEKHRREHQND